MTQIITITDVASQHKDIAYAAKIIRQGGIVAFPTETVYGLGANALNPDAVNKIFLAKKRPADNPLIVHLADFHDLPDYVSDIPDIVTILAEKFWPGPLTLVLKKKPVIPDIVTADLDTVCIRIPDHPVALALIKQAGVPIAAPSANISTRPSATTAEHVNDDFPSGIDLIVNAGPVKIGVESTVIDITKKPPIILRPGGLSIESLQKILPDLTDGSGQTRLIHSPGMKYKHYAPKCEVWLFTGTEENIIKNMTINFLKSTDQSTIKILSLFPVPQILGQQQIIFPDKHMFAQNLFHEFRQAEKSNVSRIFVSAVSEGEIGFALMNRIRKSATRIIT